MTRGEALAGRSTYWVWQSEETIRHPGPKVDQNVTKELLSIPQPRPQQVWLLVSALHSCRTGFRWRAFRWVLICQVPVSLGFLSKTGLLAAESSLSNSLNNHQVFGLGVGACPTETTPTDTEGTYHRGIEIAVDPVGRGVSISR